LVGELVDHVRAVAVGVVDLHERLPLRRERVLREDRLDRALRLAGAAVDALLGVDHEDALELVDAVDRADVHAGEVFDVDAGLGDDVRHSGAQSSQTGRSGRQLLDDLLRPLVQGRLGHHLVEARGMRTPQSLGVRVVREAEDRYIGPGVCDLVRVDAGDVRDHAVGRVDVVDRDQVVAGEKPLQLPAEEEVDPHQQDRRHAANVAPSRLVSNAVSKLETGLGLIRRGEYFAAHEELEDAWRAAEPEERDFYQGLVHVAVAWYQAGRGNRVGCERQLEKATRRLGPYAPEHRGVNVASLLDQVTTATETV